MRLVVVALVAAAAVAVPAGQAALGPPAKACGVERWAVKTLQDPAAGRVGLVPKPTTVAALRKPPVRRGSERGARRGRGVDALAADCATARGEDRARLRRPPRD